MRYTAIIMLAVLALAPCLVWGMGERLRLPPLEVVPHVDLNRYMGEWYEIARFPHRFQEGCVATKATYTLRADGKVDVLNECRSERLDGPLKTARGTARVVDETTNAKLKVTFFWPFYGAYWIIGLGDNYDFAVVGHPDREYLWVLSRTPMMEESLYAQILEKLGTQGYDVSRLIKTPQPKVTP